MSFFFGGGGAGGGKVQQQPPTGSSLFGGAVAAPQPPQTGGTSSQPQAPQTTSFSFGSSAAPASASVPSTGQFGSAPAAAAPPAPSPCPAPSPGGFFGAASSSQEQQPQTPQPHQPQQSTLSTLAPAAPAPASSSSFSFGGLAPAAGAGATTSATAPAACSTAVATSSTSGSGNDSNQAAVPRPSVKVDLRSLFSDALTDPRLFSDEEVSEQLDLLLEPGGPSASASEALKCALKSLSFRERVVASLEENSALHFYGVATEQTGKDFDSFAKGQKGMCLLHGWDPKREASDLQGKVDLVEGVKGLSRYLRLTEERAMQVLFLYLKDQVRLGLLGEMDSREYASLALHDRVRRFYHNQRVFFLKNMQEFLRIDLDPDYFQPELRHEVQQLLDGLSQAGAGASSFVDRLLGAFRSLCHDMPPHAQELSRAYPGTTATRQGRSPPTWEKVRQEWVEQNVVEQGEILTLLLLVLAQRVSLGFGSWCQLLDLWRDLRMGELTPEKAYLIAEDATTLRRARRVSGLMTLVAIQGLQLGSLALPSAVGGIGGEEHPFAAELMQLPKGGAVQIEELFYAMRDPARAEDYLAAPELISVILLFFTCFLHLSGPGLRSQLSPDLKRRFWDRAAELQAYVTQRAAQAHLAELVATLLSDDEGAAAAAVAMTATPDTGGSVLDQWARLGFHSVLRREADCLRPGLSRPEVEALQVPLSDAVNALVAACYAGLPQGPPPLHNQSMTTKKVEYFVFLVATIYHGHSPLAYCFWEASGLAAGLQLEAVEDASGMQLSSMDGRNENAGHPLEFLATEARERHPLLYFHLVASMACDAATATWVAVELSRAPLSTQAYDERVLEHLGERSYRVQQESSFFDPETGVLVPPGTQGELVQEAPGRVPRLMRWDMSLWAAVVHQLEDFAGFVARCHLLPMVDTLEGLRRKAMAGEGLQELGFNTVVDRCPSLFVYGPCPARTEDVVRELLRRGAWGMVRYILRRVEMVLDQFSLLLGLEQRQQQQQARRRAAGGSDDPAPLSLLDVLTEADGVSTVGMAPLAHRLPARLFDVVRVASEALTGRNEETDVEALVDLQVSALSLLGRLVRTNSPLPWRAEAVRTLVMEVGDVTGGQERVPVIVWVGLRSMEAERTLNQYRITRVVLLLMHSLVESACDVNWEGKEMVLPSGLSDDFVTRLVDFSTKVLLFLEAWTFTRSLDRWLLALTCLDLLAIYSSTPFAAPAGVLAHESTWGLENHRQSLLRRFRQDGALMRMLLRCAEYLPGSALRDMLKTRTKRKMPHRFLDELHSDGAESPEGAQGLFVARDGILPLAFDRKGLGSTASREEMAVLQRLGTASLKMLSCVIKHYLASPTPTASAETPHLFDAAGPGALEMIMQGADIAFWGSQSQDQSPQSFFNHAGGRRRPFVTHITLIASLVTYGEGEAAGGAAGIHLSISAMELLGLVVRYLQRNCRLRQKELMADLPDWPRNLPYPFPPGVMEDILSVTDARGFRQGLFAALARASTSGGVLVAMLDLLVDVTRLQPSLAKHLVFFRPRPAGSSSSNSRSNSNEKGKRGADQRLEEVLLAILHKAQGLVQTDLDRECQRRGGKGRRTRMREMREGESGMLVLASALRFLCVCLRRATPARRLELVSLLDPAVWGVLEWAVQNVILEEASEVKVAEVLTHCHRLSVHRFVLEILSLLTTVMIDTSEQQQQQGGGGRALSLRNLEMAVPKLIKALLGGPHMSALLNQYLTASFRPEFVEDLSGRAAGPQGEIPLTRFRLPDWEVMLTDSNPSRYGSEGFFFDLPAVVRLLHATRVGAEMGEEKRVDVERAVRLLNQYYSISAAQHMVNKACKGLLMVLLGHMRPDMGHSEAWNGSVNVDSVAHTTLHILIGDEERLRCGMSAFEGPGRESSSSSSGGTRNSSRNDDPTKEAARRWRADSVDVARKMRQPMLELMLTIVDRYAPDLTEEIVNDILRTVQQSFQECKTENAFLEVGVVVGSSSSRCSSELSLLDLRQCLLTTSLILLQIHPLDGTGYIVSGQSQLEGILAYTIGSLSSLDTLLVEGSQEPMAPTCRSERLDAVLRTAVALLSTLLMPRTHEPDVPMPALSGGDEEKQNQMQDLHQQQEEAETVILRKFREHRILSSLLRHWTAASRVAATAFAALHDYTTVSGHAARSTAAQEALLDKSVHVAVKRLRTLLRFLEAAAFTSKEFCRELLQAGWVTLLMEDPVVACLVRAVEGGAHGMGMEQLLYRRGYRADGEESPYYALWRGLVRLMARLLHSLTPPNLGYEAVLALHLDERDPSLAYANPLTPDEATVVREVAGFWRRLSPLLLWPLGEDKVLTLGLLREAQSVLALAREMAVHGYTWRVAEPARAEELRTLIKGMVVRTSLVLGQVQSMAGNDGGTPVLSVLREAFAPVSPEEARQYRSWEEGQWETEDNGNGKSTSLTGVGGLEEKVSDMLIAILGSALGFLRYTGPLRLPKHIPLTPEEAAQVILAEGTRVWYRRDGSQGLEEGIVQRRVREFHPQEACRMGTYDLVRRRDNRVETGVRPERVAIMEDRQQDQDQAQDFDFDLLDSGTVVPSFNNGRLSGAHLLVLARYALDSLRRLPTEEEADSSGEEMGQKTRAVREEQEGHCTNLLIHALYLLLVASRSFLRARGGLIQNKERVLPRFMTALMDVLWDATEWRHGRYRAEYGTYDTTGGDGGGSNTYTQGSSSFPHHHHAPLHDIFASVSESDSAEERLVNLRERIDQLVGKIRAGQELEAGELQAVLLSCYRCMKSLPSGLPAWLVAEAGQHGYEVGLGDYAAALRASSQDPKLTRMVDLLDDMIETVGLPKLLQELNRKACAAGRAKGEGGIGLGTSCLMLPE